MREDLYINREVSWLDFNYRVLEEAYDKTNPIMDRYKVLAITASLGVADYICGVSGGPAAARAVLHITDDHWRTAGISSRTVPPILDRFFASLGFVDELMRLAS